MKELFNRFSKNRGKTSGLVMISFIANMLALASPLFVMLVLGRYVSYGIDATLYTLTAGIFIAVTMEIAFRLLRLRMARDLNARAEAELTAGAFGMLVSCRTDQLEKLTPENRMQFPRNLEAVASAYNATNICTVLDAPFAALFIAALFMLNPVLGIIATFFVILVFVFRYIGQTVQKRQGETLQEASTMSNTLFGDAIRSPDTVRVFDLAGRLINSWSQTSLKLAVARSQMVQSNGALENSIATLQALLGVSIIAVGATYVVAGELGIGALIGANILAARALSPISRLSQLVPLFGRAEAALVQLREMAKIEIEDGLNFPTDSCSGQLELRDISFTYEKSPMPLFESLSLHLPAGGFMLVKGGNGAGKTTLMRLILGLLMLDRGQILVDGVEVRQLSPQWWRTQIAYMPQEPQFFDASIRSNLESANPSIEEEKLVSILENAGLKQYIQENTFGLDLPLTAGGSNLALGIRKRLALARAMVRDAPIVIFDEPTEGLDAEGRSRIYAALDWLCQQGRTIIVASDDVNITKRAELILDLDRKPVPAVAQVNKAASFKAVHQ